MTIVTTPSTAIRRIGEPMMPPWGYRPRQPKPAPAPKPKTLKELAKERRIGAQKMRQQIKAGAFDAAPF